MPIINTWLTEKKNLILILRIFVGLIWGGTALRRLLMPNFSNFELRISQMAQGDPLYPPLIMDWVIANWFLIFLFVVSIELLSSISMLTGTLARAGALLATFNGFAIGLAGIGLGIIDLMIPWSVAILSLILLLFTHPGMYMGLDNKISKRNIPSWLKLLM